MSRLRHALCSMPLCPSLVPANGPAFSTAGVRDVGDPPGDIDANRVRVGAVFETCRFGRRRPGACVELEARDVAVVVADNAPVRAALTGCDVFQQVLEMDGWAAVLEIAVGETTVLWRAAAPGIEERGSFDVVGVSCSCCGDTSG